MVNIVTIWAVYQNDDDRHWGEPYWYFSTKSEATACAHKRGWYGGDAPVGEFRAVQDGDKYLLLRSERLVVLGGPDDALAAKQRIMSKLTEEELKTLGLK